MTGLKPIDPSGALLQLQDLAQKIDKCQPAPADLQALRDLLGQHPNLYRTIGDLAHHAAFNLINQAKDRPLFTESLKHALDALKLDLAYHLASPLERLVIEQLLLCWLRLNLIELTYASQLDAAPSTTLYWEKRLSAAQRRFLQACQTLASIRKISHTTPTLQVNIAAQGSRQTNLIHQELPNDQC